MVAKGPNETPRKLSARESEQQWREEVAKWTRELNKQSREDSVRAREEKVKARRAIESGKAAHLAEGNEDIEKPQEFFRTTHETGKVEVPDTAEAKAEMGKLTKMEVVTLEGGADAQWFDMKKERSADFYKKLEENVKKYRELEKYIDSNLTAEEEAKMRYLMDVVLELGKTGDYSHKKWSETLHIANAHNLADIYGARGLYNLVMMSFDRALLSIKDTVSANDFEPSGKNPFPKYDKIMLGVESSHKSRAFRKTVWVGSDKDARLTRQSENEGKKAKEKEQRAEKEQDAKEKRNAPYVKILEEKIKPGLTELLKKYEGKHILFARDTMGIGYVVYDNRENDFNPNNIIEKKIITRVKLIPGQGDEESRYNVDGEGVRVFELTKTTQVINKIGKNIDRYFDAEKGRIEDIRNRFGKLLCAFLKIDTFRDQGIHIHKPEGPENDPKAFFISVDDAKDPSKYRVLKLTVSGDTLIIGAMVKNKLYEDLAKYKVDFINGTPKPEDLIAQIRIAEEKAKEIEAGKIPKDKKADTKIELSLETEARALEGTIGKELVALTEKYKEFDVGVINPKDSKELYFEHTITVAGKKVLAFTTVVSEELGKKEKTFAVMTHGDANSLTGYDTPEQALAETKVRLENIIAANEVKKLIEAAKEHKKVGYEGVIDPKDPRKMILMKDNAPIFTIQILFSEKGKAYFYTKGKKDKAYSKGVSYEEAVKAMKAQVSSDLLLD